MGTSISPIKNTARPASSGRVSQRRAFLRVAGKEWLQITRDGRFQATAVVVLLLLGAALGLGGSQHRLARTERNAALAASRAQWLGQGPKNPHYAAHDGYTIFKPISALGFFDPGVEPYTGVAVALEAHHRNELQFRPIRDQAVLARFGEMTAATVLQLLIPLVIVLVSFATVAGEREAGLLRQVLSEPVRRSEVALGKLVGITAALGVLLVPAALLGAAVLLAGSAGSERAVEPLRIAWLAAGYLLYFAAWLGLALWVSAAAPTSQQALLWLLGIWIGGSLVVPRMAAEVARWTYPTPSVLEVVETIYTEERSAGGHSGTREGRRLLEQRLMRQYGVARVEDLPVNVMGFGMQEREEHSAQIIDRHHQRLEALMRRQNGIYALASLLAPVLPLRSLSMGLAGTDWHHDRHFAAAAESYRRDLVRALNADLAYNSRTGQRDYRAGKELWEKNPVFRYTPPSLAWVLQRQAAGVLVLGGWAAVALGLALLGMHRVRVI